MMRLFGGRRPRRMLVLGLDCAVPELVFEQFRADLPTFSHLMNQGTWGKLRSSIPCITVPAWSSMLSSRDPGVLGVYGFRNRAAYNYDDLLTADGTAVQVPRIWDVLSAAGRESVLLNIPQTYPPRPQHPSHVHMVSGFLTPGIESAFAYPAVLKQEVLKVTPDYAFDVRDFRMVERSDLWQRLIDLADVQFKVVRHCLTSKPWDFFMHVNIGLDRVQHAFWRYHDPHHRLHEPDSSFQNTIRDYYRFLDTQLANILELIDDDVVVLVVSDHGAKRMDGAICVNEWLWRNGWLALKATPPEDQITPFEQVEVDWSQTRAWGSGGYYGRLFLNVAGREPNGIVPPDQVEAVRDELAEQLAMIPDPDGRPLLTQVFKPEQIYEQVNGIAPDLMVYFGALHWRSVGSFGHGDCYTLENDTGPDDANHAEDGMFILYDPRKPGSGQVDGHQLMDITPTILDRLGGRPTADMQGKII